MTPAPIGGTRQNAFCKRHDALYVEFIELARVTLDPNERELLPQASAIVFESNLGVERGRQPSRIVAAPLAASAVSKIGT